MNTASPFIPEVLAETAHWVVVSKPAGMLSIPGSSSIHSLSAWAQKAYGAIWMVHRIDQETSGVVLMARSQEDHRRAGLWFQNREVKKIYHCLASGVPSAPLMKLNSGIAGKPCLSQVEVLESFHEGFLARVVPRTGRRHQIRIHLSQRGHSLWGDLRYGGLAEVRLGGEPISVPRVALHSSSLELPSGEKFEAPLPNDFVSWLNQLRTRGQRV